MKTSALLLAALGIAAAGCAPVMRCHQVGMIEVCEKRVCRDLANGQFVECP